MRPFMKLFSCRRCILQNWPKISQRRLHTKSYLFTTVANVQRTSKSIDYFKEMVVSLDTNEKQHLRTALEEIDACANHNEISTYQLKLVFMHSTLPFIGFGFFDNAIMILAGEYIDMTIGITLGISTMAAAACGNLISDLFGLGLADSVESLNRRLGLPNPNLSSTQMNQSSVRWSNRLGRVIGITVGCIIGMAPLLWFEEDDHHDNKDTKS